MKKLILILFLMVASSTFAQSFFLQQDTLSGADTVSYSLAGKYTFVMLTVKDDNSGNADSLYCEVAVKSQRAKVMLRDLLTFTDRSWMVGAGLTKKYLVLDPYINTLKVIRTNATGSTIIIIEGVRY